jgi:hypothetical protein
MENKDEFGGKLFNFKYGGFDFEVPNDYAD